MRDNKKIDKIDAKKLLSLMREVLDKSPDFAYIEGSQPFLMSFHSKKYYIYVKNISSAYFSDRDKTTRAQLPIKPEFESIKSSPNPFIFFGYDGLYDVLVCWNYHIAKERLNVGKSVSFYSRIHFQSEVKEGEFLRKRLKNGDLPVLFKRNNLIEFFEKIDTFFSNNLSSKQLSLVEVEKFNFEEKFKIYLKNKKNLSDKSIKNYTNALRNRINDGIRKYQISTLESIYYIDDITLLEDLKIKLFKIEEFKILDTIGKSMYSCAFENYIDFIKNGVSYEGLEKLKTVEDIQEEYSINGKLTKINDSNLLVEIDPYIKSNRLLSAAQIVGNFYQDKYPKMELSDWISLVRNL